MASDRYAAKPLMPIDGFAKRLKSVEALSKVQMSRLQRIALSGALSGLAHRLDDGERVDLLFGGQISRKQAVLALTERRVIAAYGKANTSYSIDYADIERVEGGLVKLLVKGGGVDLEVMSVALLRDLVEALEERAPNAQIDLL
jgi:hypothetical protein